MPSETNVNGYLASTTSPKLNPVVRSALSIESTETWVLADGTSSGHALEQDGVVTFKLLFTAKTSTAAVTAAGTAITSLQFPGITPPTDLLTFTAVDRTGRLPCHLVIGPTGMYLENDSLVSALPIGAVVTVEGSYLVGSRMTALSHTD